jgi:hypothetical protein
MKVTLELINQMQSQGVVGRYAIGGAVGATFYLEPAATFGLDVFVILPTTQSRSLLSLSPIYEFLTARGGRVEGEHVTIGGWPVQFLPASDDFARTGCSDRGRGSENLGHDSRAPGRYCTPNRGTRTMRAFCNFWRPQWSIENS